MHSKFMIFHFLQLTTLVHLTNEPELGGESSTDNDVSPGTSAKESSFQASQEGTEEPASTFARGFKCFMTVKVRFRYWDVL